MTRLKKRFLIPGVLAGIIILVLSIVFRSSPSVQPNFDKARLVEVEPLSLKPNSPSVVAFGRVEPKNSWQAIAEVSGKVVYRYPELEVGRLLPAGTLVLKVDPLAYELKQTQASANVSASNAQLKRLLQEQKNINASLSIEKEKLALVEQEYQRKLSLQQKKLISSSDLESQKQTLLIQKKLVQDLSSALSLIPDDTKVAEAQLNVNEALLVDAQRALDDTRLTLPFDARVSTVNVEASQAVSVGEVLFEVDKLGAVEVKAELSLQDAEMLMASVNLQSEQGRLPDIESLGLKADVALQVGNKVYQWPAKLTRVAGSVDAEQATMGFYLEIVQDIQQLGIAKKPLLTKGMFVAANIYGFASEQFMIAEKALHGDQVYVMDENKQLSIREVKVLFRNKTGVAISGDIKAGELLILNDLIPAIPGMSLKTQTATTTEESNS
jgi:hypothetical protein